MNEETNCEIMEGYKQHPIKRHFYTEKERLEDSNIQNDIPIPTMKKAIEFLGPSSKEEDLPEWLQGLDKKEEPLFKLEKEETTDIQPWIPQDIVLDEELINSGIITDRLFDLAKFEKPLSKWAYAIHHVVCHVLFHNYIKNHPLMKKKVFTTNDFVDMIQSFPEDIQIYLPKISFTDAEFRQITGKKLRGSQIKKYVKEYEDAKIKVIHASIYNKEENKNVKIETERLAYTREPVGKILYLETNTIYTYKNRKTKKIKRVKENKYYIKFNLLGFIIMCRFFNQNFEIKDENIYQLSDKALPDRAFQIYIKISPFNSVKRNIVTLSEYAEYSTENFHVPKRKKDLEKLLDKLKDDNLIYSWYRMRDKSGRELQGMDTIYFIKVKLPKFIQKMLKRVV